MVNSSLLARQNYEVDWPSKGYGEVHGRLAGTVVTLVNLFNENKDESQFNTVGSWIELSSSGSSSNASIGCESLCGRFSAEGRDTALTRDTLVPGDCRG